MTSAANRIRRKRWPLISGALIGLLGCFLAGWAFWWEPSQLVVTHTALSLPPPFSLTRPLKIAVLSDLHVGAPYITLEKLQAVVDRTNQEAPDLVVLLGDYVPTGVTGARYVAPETFSPILGRLHAPWGVFAVLGNHDWWADGPGIATALRASGITVLEDQAQRVEHLGESFWLVGLEDLMTRRPDLGKVLRGTGDDLAMIVLTHSPDVFPDVPARVSLTLAGHTHGGQVNLPLLGRLVVPSKYRARFAAGHIVEGGRHMFVTTGIGTSIIPVRFRVPPEIAIVTVRGTAD